MRTPIEYYVVDFNATEGVFETEQQLNSVGQNGWRLVAIRNMVDGENGKYKVARCIFSRRKHTDPTE